MKNITSKILNKERKTLKQKEANDFKYYKDKAKEILTYHKTYISTPDYFKGQGSTPISEAARIKINSDLYNNIVHPEDFKNWCKVKHNGKDIHDKIGTDDLVRRKIKAIEGMYNKLPYSYEFMAINAEATTRREETEMGEIRKYIIDQIMQPIRVEEEKKYAAQLQNRDLTPEEHKAIEQEIEAAIKQREPERIRAYMSREYQDPAEVMSNQLMRILWKQLDMEKKFRTGFKNLSLAAKTIFYVGVLNGQPVVLNCNSRRFSFIKSEHAEGIEDGEAACHEFRFTRSEIIKHFGDSLTKEQVDKIYNFTYGYQSEERIRESMFRYDYEDTNDYNNTIPVHLVQWKGLRKWVTLYYQDADGSTQTRHVFEEYKLNKEAGDIRLEVEWIPETSQTFIIGDDIYLNMGPTENQLRDPDNPYECKLSFYGICLDDNNSRPTGPADVLKPFVYNILLYKYQLNKLFASDKGKKILFNINNIPDSAGIDLATWKEYFEESPYAFFDESEEGNGYVDTNSVAKVLDMSLISDIDKYINLIKQEKEDAGYAVGATPQIEGIIGAREAVANTEYSINQSSNVLELMFTTYEAAKNKIVEAVLEAAKIAYHGRGKVKFAYKLDDMSTELLDIDFGLILNSKLAIHVANNLEVMRMKQILQRTFDAAIASGQARASDALSILGKKSITEAEEALKESENKVREFEMQKIEQEKESNLAVLAKQDENNQREHERKKELIILENMEKRKTEVVKGGLIGASYNPDADEDNDGLNDFIEMADKAAETDLKLRQQNLKEEEFAHKKEVDTEKLKLERRKVSNAK